MPQTAVTAESITDRHIDGLTRHPVAVAHDPGPLTDGRIRQRVEVDRHTPARCWTAGEHGLHRDDRPNAVAWVSPRSWSSTSSSRLAHTSKRARSNRVSISGECAVASI